MNEQENNMINCLFDSSALLAVIKREQGYEEIEKYLKNSFISSVNYSEVITILSLAKMPLFEAENIIKPLIHKIVPFDTQLAGLTGELTTITSEFGLSLGDRACIATAKFFDYDIITTDKIWSKLNLPVRISVMR
ncbi:PIN domain-containing protein [soil metagenome]